MRTFVKAAMHETLGGRRPILIVAAVALLSMVVYVATSARGYIYDEHYYIQGAQLLASGVSYRTFLLAPLDTPAGPLYATLHWLLSSLTGLKAPAIRWVNLILLGASLVALAKTMRLWGLDRVWDRALMLVAVPTIWVTTGMALTEIPAVTAITFGVLCTAFAMTTAATARRRIWIFFIGAGVLSGIGILGRQPFLPAVIGFVFVAIFTPRLRWPAIVAAVLALAVPAPVFLLWGGLVPPTMRFVGASIKFEYGALGFAYAAVFVLLLAPRYFMTRWKFVLAISAVTAMILSLGGGISIEIAAGIARRLPARLAQSFQFGMSTIMICSGVAFILASVVNIWELRHDCVFVLLTVLTLGLAATPAFVSHQFSSRYLMMTFPFLLLMVQPFFRPNLWAAARLAVGATLGFLSLQAYLSQQPWPN